MAPGDNHVVQPQDLVLEWSPNGSCAAEQWRVQLSLGDDVFAPNETYWLPGDQTSWAPAEELGMENCQTWYWRVSGVTDGGNHSGSWSATWRFHTGCG